MKVKVDIFSGFLGAGKTRLIRKLIEDKYYKEKIAIVENEFGEVSIDGAILRETNTVVQEISAGCICCQVSGNFKKSIGNLIRNYDIDRLIIEPTGVAKLSELKKTFEDKDLKDEVEIDRLITVVDSERFYIYLNNFKKFFVDQIKAADVIILSRTQNLSEDAVSKLEDDIHKLNSNGRIITADWNKVKAQELIPVVKSINKSVSRYINKMQLKPGSRINAHKDYADDTFQTFAINMKRKLSEKELISKFNFIANTDGFGEIVRAKGIVKLSDETMKQFDLSLDEFSIESISYEGDGVISFIGIDLNKEEIKRFFQ